MRSMSLDVGTRTIGVAASDLMGMIANGVETIRRTSEERDLQRIGELIAEYEVDTMVVGYPKNMNGSVGERAQSCEDFARVIGERFPQLKIVLWDERLSTVAAEKVLIDADLRRSKRKLVGGTLDEVLEGELVITLGRGGVCLVLLGQHHLMGRGAGHHQRDVHVKAQHGFKGLFQQAEVAVGDDLADEIVAHRQGDMAGVLKADGLQPVDIEIVRWLGHLRLAVHLGRF